MRGFHKNIREAESRKEFVRDYCEGCLNLRPRAAECLVLSVPYPLWGKGECWARIESRREYLKRLDEMEDYALSRGGHPPGIRLRFKRDRERVSSIPDHEIREVYEEEKNKPLLKPPKGEGQDRTHKLFPASRMKDNRYKPPWEGF